MLSRYSRDYDKEQYVEDGYTIIKNAFPTEDLEAFRLAFQNVISVVLKRAAEKHPELKGAVVGEYCDEGLLALRQFDPEYLAVAQRLISRSPEFFRLSSNPKVFAIIRDLMDLPELSPLYLLSNGIVMTAPNSNKYSLSSDLTLDWHKDNFFTIPESEYIQFWAPLIHDAKKSIGPLKLCKGSHKAGIDKQIFQPDESYIHQYVMEPGVADQYDHVSPEVQLGDLLLFHHHLIHASGVNSTQNNVRISIIGLSHNASRNECDPLLIEYRYKNKTPEEWFYEVFSDENAKRMSSIHASVGEPVGGV